MCDTLVCNVSRDNCAIPHKTSTKEFCDTIATNIAQYEKYRCWASKKVQELDPWRCPIDSCLSAQYDVQNWHSDCSCAKCAASENPAESHRPLTATLLEKYRDTLPFSIAILLQYFALQLFESYTPPI